jgi:hypothetical protein
MIELPSDVTRLAFLGDLHCDYEYTRKAIVRAKKEGAQVIVQLGDFGYQFPDTYLDMIQGWMHSYGMLFTFIDGNHENFDILYSYPVSEDGVRRLRERLWHLPRGFRWNWSGVNFLALGGAHSVDKSGRTPGASWWPQEHINYAEFATTIEGGPTDVMVTHDCPKGFDLKLGDSSWIPEEDLVSADMHRHIVFSVVQAVTPKWLFHGHYHKYLADTFMYPVDTFYSNATTRIVGLGCNGMPLDQVVKVMDIDDLR